MELIAKSTVNDKYMNVLLNKLIIFFILYFSVLSCFSQNNENYSLQGIIYGQNYSNVVGTVYITKNGSTIKIRQEFLNEPTDYLLFDGSYTLKAQQHVFSEGALISKKIGLKNQICKSSISIYSEDTLGYWRG